MGLCELDLKMYVKKGISNLKLSEAVDKNGAYDVYGASGLIGKIDFFHQGLHMLLSILSTFDFSDFKSDLYSFIAFFAWFISLDI